uniref:dihydroxyacetone kinase subunit DhaL n=1 Tax=Pararhizobium sp. IMCC3301 TaxID=3067904 RepID=UPI002741963A|nr:dihydroxyacetone kinase subunit DhaL [Pararhizobium sp. IMCC3301]
MLEKDDIAALIGVCADVIESHADELSELDSAIGDGDHGYNMKRGFAAMRADAQAISQKPFPEAVTAAGMKLVMTVGGASGPLFGTFLMTLGKQIDQDMDQAGFAEAFTKATESVAARGKSKAGQKTMLDVLYPVSKALAEEKSGAEITEVADAAVEATKPLAAQRGRASFLGERSVGHVDPGSKSTALLVGAVAQWLEQRT